MLISMLMQLIPFIYKLVFIILIAAGLSSYLLSAWKNTKKNLIQLQRLHEIPCSHCLFFTGEYNLKCAVHPCNALSEKAIGCADYQNSKRGSVNDSKI
jgi:hypothetical protein